MWLTIEPTAEIVRVNGTACRIWTGRDQNGTEVRVWAAVVQPQTHDELRLAAFERELQELPAPSMAVAVDMRFIVD